MITKADIEFFKEAKRIQELWEPKKGDFVLRSSHDFPDAEPWVDTVWKCTRVGVLCHESGYHNTEYWEDFALDEVVWLPRPDQLWEMLEERGYGLYHLGDERLQPDFDGRKWNRKEPYIAIAEREGWAGDYVKGTGPTPSIALGKCLLEVLKEE